MTKKRTMSMGVTVIAILATLTTTFASTATADGVDDQMAQMSLRYGSLSAGLQQGYAHQKGMSLASFLLGNPGQLANVAGLDANDPRVASMLKSLGPNATTSDLELALSSGGLSLTSSAYQSVSAAAAEIHSKAGSLDAAVVQAGVNWTAKMVALRAPELAIPSIPGMDTSAITGMPAEGLAFGMFTNRSLNTFVRSFPDVFSQVSATGIGSPAQQAAWNKSISTAMTNSKPDLSKMLPSACGSAFLAGLSGGSYSSGCSPCIAAGRVASGQLQLIFDPAAGSVIPNPSNSSLSPAEWSNLTPAQRSALAAQNPNVASSLAATQGSTTSSGCGAASSAVQRNVTETVPKVLDFLGGK